MQNWKEIKDYSDYLISNRGLVKSLKFNKETILKPKLDREGYLRVNLLKKGKRKTYRIHILVAKHFIPNLLNKPCINHIDGNKNNNFESNLEWVTYSENNKHAINTKLRKITKGEVIGMSKLKPEDIIQIRNLLSSKMKNFKIAEIYKVSPTNISHIKKGKIWKHIIS